MEGAQYKPIETYYNDYRFRSRHEARWAVFFDAMGIKYQYEPEGKTTCGVPYLVDFFLPEVKHPLFQDYGQGGEVGWMCKDAETGVFVEVKGDMGDNDLEKIVSFSTIAPIIVVGDIPKDVSDAYHISRDWLWKGKVYVGDFSGSLIVNEAISWYQDKLFFTRHKDEIWLCGEKAPEWNGEVEMDAALKIARQARFEHGETPTADEVRQKMLRMVQSENRLESFDERVRAMNSQTTYGEYPKRMSAENIRQAIENISNMARARYNNTGSPTQGQTAKTSRKYELDLSPLHRIGQQESEHDAT